MADRIEWGEYQWKLLKKIFEDIYMDKTGLCELTGFVCPMDKYGINCDKDNDHHCAYSDFIFHCLEISPRLRKQKSE